MLIVKFLAPTNTRGSRWRATGWQGSVTMAQDYARDPRDNAQAAADAYCAKYADDSVPVIIGQVPCGSERGSYAFDLVDLPGANE